MAFSMQISDYLFIITFCCDTKGIFFFLSLSMLWIVFLQRFALRLFYLLLLSDLTCRTRSAKPSPTSLNSNTLYFIVFCSPLNYTNSCTYTDHKGIWEMVSVDTAQSLSKALECFFFFSQIHTTCRGKSVNKAVLAGASSDKWPLEGGGVKEECTGNYRNAMHSCHPTEPK